MTPTISILNDQEGTWIQDCARRLRLIQSDAVHATPEQRRELLHEETARSLKSVPPANRKRFLEALLARFPVAGQIPRAVVPVAAPAPAPPPPETFDQLFARFLKQVAELPEPQRADIAKRLADAGLTWVDHDAMVLEVSEELRKSLGLPASQQPRLTRMVELTVFLVDLLARLDERALATVKELAPRSSLGKRTQDVRGTAARFLSSDGDQLEAQLRPTSSLLGALLAAMLGGGKDFGRQYVERFSPTAIEDVVMGEGKGSGIFFGKTKKEHCWDKYTDLASDFATADLVDRRIKDCLAAFVESRVLGRK